jgi:pSer/pThr/pTyr-binding forkhead associated (FHA) protein
MPQGVEITLLVRIGPQQGLRYHLARPEVRIGRRKDMDLILSDTTVSAEHARVFFQEGGLWIEDLKSMNGTLVNDRRIRRSLLQANDRITLGKYELEVQMEVPGPKPEKGVTPSVEPEPSVKPEIQEVWLAGFTPALRQVLIEVVEETLVGHATALIILDIRMPLISGVNTAISIRAFEQGFARPKKIPIAFFGQVPNPVSFEKVLQFCQPASYLPTASQAKEFRMQAVKLIAKAKKGLSGRPSD